MVLLGRILRLRDWHHLCVVCLGPAVELGSPSCHRTWRHLLPAQLLATVFPLGQQHLGFDPSGFP